MLFYIKELYSKNGIVASTVSAYTLTKKWTLAFHKGTALFVHFSLLGKSPNPYEKYNIFYFSIEIFSKIQPCNTLILLNFSSKNDILSL